MADSRRPHTTTRSPTRTSVQLVRREAAAPKGQGKGIAPSRGDAEQEFLAGVKYVTRGIGAGETAEQAFDLAATSADRRSRSFMNGADLARILYYVAHGLPVPARDRGAIARNTKNEIAPTLRLAEPGSPHR